MTKRKWVNGSVFCGGRFQPLDVTVEDGRIVALTPSQPASLSSLPTPTPVDSSIVDLTGLFLFPGFVDLHVHFREPGFSYKETIASGSLAAASGGYTVCCTMPNLNPVPDTLEHLNVQRDIIRNDACIHVLPYGAITTGEQGETLADFEAMAPYVVGMTDDGVGVASEDVMRRAMRAAKKVDKPIVAHAEDLPLVNGGVIHEGTYAARHHHKGNPSASEWKQVERDIRLAEETGARYHVCHISTKESVALVRHAKAQGLPVSGETCPHYLTMTDEDLQEEGRFRMNPPIRSGADREALREAIADGTLLCITTDHAPHSEEEKSRGLDQSLNGIVGLETSFPVLYTNLVLTGLLSLERLVEAMSVAPARGLRISEVREAKETAGIGTEIAVGQPADFAVWDLDASWTIDPRQFHSKGASTPFQGWTVRGLCQSTVISGEEVYHAHGWKPRERRLKKENENE